MLRSIFLIAILTGLGFAAPVLAQDQEKRLQRLEEQMVDLNAQLGTVESMARGGGGQAAPAGGGDEGQVRALSAQLNEMMRRLERLEARLGAAPPAGDNPTFGEARPQRNDRQGRARPAEQGTGFSIGGLDEQDDQPPAGAAPPPLQQRGAAPNAAPANSWSATEAPRGNQRNSWSSETAPLPQAGAAPGSAPVRVAALSSPQAQSAYDQAYSSFQQQNFRAASAGFEQFLQRYPSDPLAGTASFWAGEAAFTSGEYRKAADLYLKTATNYPENEKAPESMLKLGISLKRLGENDAACSTFVELGKRYPNASALLQRADTEKRRSSC